MEPLSRYVVEFPIYGMEVLDDGCFAIAGGGGRMKSGIPNACVRLCPLCFTPESFTFNLRHDFLRSINHKLIVFLC